MRRNKRLILLGMLLTSSLAVSLPLMSCASTTEIVEQCKKPECMFKPASGDYIFSFHNIIAVSNKTFIGYHIVSVMFGNSQIARNFDTNATDYERYAKWSCGADKALPPYNI